MEPEVWIKELSFEVFGREGKPGGHGNPLVSIALPIRHARIASSYCLIIRRFILKNM